MNFLKSLFFNSVKMTTNRTNKPIVVILGATGTGKTKLSVEIASRYDGEVINADAMQMYKGLDIITNKATEEECKDIPHHMLGVLEASSRTTVVGFQKSALSVINNLHDRNKLPIVVGGTNYYLESLLYTTMCSYWGESFDDCQAVGSDSTSWCESVKSVKSLSVEESDLKERAIKLLGDADSSSNERYQMLEEIDPDIASTLHNNDARKITRAIEVWLKSGQRLSEIYNKQKLESGGKALGGEKRFENVLILWLKCETEILRARLKERVGDMIYRGLLDEVEQFHAQYNDKYVTEASQYDKRGLPIHYQHGVFQCIGFKEFHNYLMLSQENRDSKKGRRCYIQAKELMTQRTTNYVKRQHQWIRNRLLIRDRLTFPVYSVDTADPSKWDEIVTPRVDIMMNAFIRGSAIPFEAEAVKEIEKKECLVKGDRKRYHCELCDSFLIGKEQYDVHMKGRRHKKTLMAQARQRDQQSNASECETDFSVGECGADDQSTKRRPVQNV